MSLPRLLKDLNVFIDGASFLGEARQAKLPNLARKLEAYRGGGMHRAVGVDLGSDDLMEMEITFAGYIRAVLNGFAAATIDAVQVRLVGAFQQDDTGEVSAYEVVGRGRWSEIDRGEWKTGEIGEFKPKFVLAYYKEMINGNVVYEDDPMNNILIVDGVDRMAERRAAIQA